MTRATRSTLRTGTLAILAALALLVFLQSGPEVAPRHPVSTAIPLAAITPAALEVDTRAAAELYRHLPLRFEPSADPRMEFIARGPGYWLGLSGGEIVIAARGPQQETAEPLRISFLGALPAAQLSGARELPGVSNYYTGDDPSEWRTGVSQFGAVAYRGLYPGVDAVFYGTPQELEFDFIVASGADPAEIRLLFGGAPITLGENGDLISQIGEQEIRLQHPVIYQERNGLRQPVAGGFAVAGNTVSFTVGKYDHARPLVIDPVLLYAGYLGGSAADSIHTVAVDASGNILVAGSTQSTTFPLQSPAQDNNRGGTDGFVSKLSPTGGALLYSTYIGGAQTDEITAITIDSSGGAWVAGYTNSANFPLLSPIQASISPGFDATVSRFSTGGILQFSTFFGGNGDDAARAIAQDVSAAYVVIDTFSTNLPVGISAQPNFGGGSPATCPVLATGQALAGDVFVIKVSATGSFLNYSTYLGGSGCEAGRGIAVDGSGNAYVTGATTSSNFPTVAPLQTTIGGGTCTPFGGGASFPCPDAFVAKLNSGGSTLLYSTYLGGNSLDDGYAIALDPDSNIYLTGDTQSPNFPVANALDSTLSGTLDAFVSKLNAAGTSLLFSTYLGGGGSDYGRAVKVDPTRRVFVAGHTNSSDFPISSELKASLAGGLDMFAATIRANGAGLDFSTFYGSPGDDLARGLALDSSGNLWVGGYTLSNAFPTFAPLQASFGGVIDGALFKTGPVAAGGFPSISAGGVVNNASFAAAPAPLAPGSIAAVFGSSLTNGSTILSTSFDSNGRLITNLGGTSVTVNDVLAPMFYATPGQVGIQIPFEVAGQASATVRVFVGGQGSPAQVVPISSFAPGIFTINQQGTGTAAALHQDGVTPVTSGNPARLNETIVFFATGLGITSPALPTGAPSAGNTTNTLANATVGGLPAVVDFSGTAPGFVGLNQVNVRIPGNTATGGAVPVVFSVGGQQSSTVFLPVTP